MGRFGIVDFSAWQTQDWVAAYGAALATILAVAQLSLWLFSRSPSVDSTYSLLDHEAYPDRITVANLRGTPLMVSSWTLEWVPTYGRFWLGSSDQTPEGEPDADFGFVVPGHSVLDLKFIAQNKIKWSHAVSNGRKLRLSLNVFGRKRPLRVTISKG